MDPSAQHRREPPITTQVLQRIKQAEGEVDALLQAARRARDETVAKARQDALRHVRAVEDKARATYEQRLDAARTEAEREAQALGRDADRQVEALQKAFDAGVGAARRRILEIFERALDAQD